MGQANSHYVSERQLMILLSFEMYNPFIGFSLLSPNHILELSLLESKSGLNCLRWLQSNYSKTMFRPIAGHYFGAGLQSNYISSGPRFPWLGSIRHSPSDDMNAFSPPALAETRSLVKIRKDWGKIGNDCGRCNRIRLFL
jgi:hypothetical protein